MASSLRRKYWIFSPLTLHIMLVNVTALFILALAFLYTGQYERELIKGELKALSSEAQLLADSIAEGGVRDIYSMRPTLSSDLTRPLIRRLIDNSSLRLILFDKSGEMLLDSHQMMGGGSCKWLNFRHRLVV